MHEELVEYELPPNNNKSVVNGNLSIEYSPNSHVGDKYYIYGPVTYLHPNGEEEKKINSTPYILDAATLKEGLQSQGNTHNDDSTVCIVDERKFKIRRLHILIAACLLVLITTATLLTVFLGTGNSSDIDSDDDADLEIIPRGEWFALNRKKPVENMPIKPTPYIILFDATGMTCTSKSNCANVVRFIQNNHFNMGYYDIGYNFIIGGDGSVFEGRGWDVQGAHTLHLNNRSIGISFIGNYANHEPKKRMINSFWKLVNVGVESNELDANFTIFTHRQIRKSDSPGKALYNLITTWPHWRGYDSSKDIPPYNLFQ